jgi:hypothetical protein
MTGDVDLNEEEDSDFDAPEDKVDEKADKPVNNVRKAEEGFMNDKVKIPVPEDEEPAIGDPDTEFSLSW